MTRDGSMGPPTEDFEVCDDDLAAELAFGALEGAELEALRDREARDPEFRRKVAAWREVLAAQHHDEYGEEGPPSWVKTSVDNVIDSEDLPHFSHRARPSRQMAATPVIWANALLWRLATAALALTLIVQNVMYYNDVRWSPTANASVYTATFTNSQDGGRIVVYYAPAIGVVHAVRFYGDRMDTEFAAHQVELWLVDEKDAPVRSLSRTERADAQEAIVKHSIDSGAPMDVTVGTRLELRLQGSDEPVAYAAARSL